MRPVITILALVLAVGPLAAQMPPAGHDGWTICRPDGRIEVWFRDPTLVGMALASPWGMRAEVEALRRHEQAHVTQLRQYGDCRIAMGFLAVPDSIVAWEAEAYCVQAMSLEAHGAADRRDLSGLFLARLLGDVRLSRSDPQHLTRVWAGRWRAACG